MQLVLTYHRIVERLSAVDEFFDVTVQEFEHHLQIARRTWGTGVSLGHLLPFPNRRVSGRDGFLVTFDDGTTDHYAIAAPLLERNGLRGVFFVNTGMLSTPGFMTIEQCLDLQSRGHAIESHSHDHVTLTELSDSDLRWHLVESRQRLRAAGLGQHDCIAVPGGFFDARVMHAAAASGYRLLRTLEWGYNRTLHPLRLESITMNRQTAGRCCGVLISPHGETAKKKFYRAKEVVKRTGPSLYFPLRDLANGQQLNKGNPRG